MKKLASFFSILTFIFFGFSGLVFAQPVPISTEPTLELDVSFSYESGSLVGQEVTPPLRIQVSGLNLQEVSSGNYSISVWVNSETGAPWWTTSENFTADSNGFFEGGEQILTTNSQVTVGSETVDVENYIIKTILLDPNLPVGFISAETTLSRPQENNPAIEISQPTQTISGGVTTAVSYQVTGSGLFPNTEYVTTVEIHAENEVGVIVYDEDFTITTGGSGGFTLTPTAWNPTQVNQTNQEGSTLEQIQNNNLNTEAVNVFVIKASLQSSHSLLTSTQTIETQGVAETIDPETTSTNNDCVDRDGVYCLLEPIGTGGTRWTFIDTSTQFGSYLNGMFQIGVALAGVIGVLLIVVGGFQYMTTDAIGKKEDGRKQILNAVYGVILALTAWLILNTINPGLLNFSIGAYEINKPVNQTTESSTVAHVGGCSAHTINGSEIESGDTWPSDAQAVATLRNAGVDISSTGGYQACTTVGQTGCTSVYWEGSSAQMVQKIIAFKNACDQATAAPLGECRVVVTGGSECWGHQTHGPTSNVVDFRNNPDVDPNPQGITNTNNFITSFGSGSPYQVTNYGQFVGEPAGANANTTAQHWHVTFQ